MDELLRYRRAGEAWVAVDGTNRPIAYLIAEPVDGNVYVEQVSVHPDHAGHGVGRSLLELLAKRVSADGVPALILTTFTRVPWNAPYYARCGFRRLDPAELTPGLRTIREREAARGSGRSWCPCCER